MYHNVKIRAKSRVQVITDNMYYSPKAFKYDKMDMKYTKLYVMYMVRIHYHINYILHKTLY